MDDVLHSRVYHPQPRDVISPRLPEELHGTERLTHAVDDRSQKRAIRGGHSLSDPDHRMQKPAGRHSHPVIEIIEKGLEAADDYGGYFSYANTALKVWAGTEAFRKFDIIRALPVRNVNDTLIGRVVNARLRAVFDISANVGEHAERIGTFVSVAHDLLRYRHQFAAVGRSQDPVPLQAMRYASLVGTIANHTLVGSVPTGARVLYFSAQGYCQAIGLAGEWLQSSGVQSGADACVQTLTRAEAYVRTSYEYLTDDSNIPGSVRLLTDKNLLKKGGAFLINLRFLAYE